MAKIVDWDDYIGRRLRLRDLRVLFLVIELGSFAKAAARLRVSQPAVSKVISDLEHQLGVRLFDRTTRGVEPTLYGQAMLARGRAAFDDLRQGIRDIEFLSDPEAGEVRIGSPDVLMAGFVAAIIDRIAREAPRVTFHTVQGNGRSLAAALRERKVDVIMSRQPRSMAGDDLVSEHLFDERLLVVAGLRSRWASRRKIRLSDLLEEPWIMPTPDTVIGSLVAECFRAAGLALPRIRVASDSISLRNYLLATGGYLSVLPGSMLFFSAQQLSVKVLRVDLPGMVQPTAITSLKNRTLSPVVNRFVECCRDAARSMARMKHRA